MSNPHDYTVGWICAISTEYVAAQAFLDEQHERPESLSLKDNNDYTLGKVGKHNVVIAVLPGGEYGISSAANVARDMLHSFPNIRIGLMVGIGGGAPNSNHDIRLGDIVVSLPGNGKGGVLQYDFGKTIQGQTFQRTGFLNQPPTVLLAAVNGLKTEYEIDGHQLQEALNNVLDKKPRLRQKYKRPELRSDRLYQTSFIHPPNNNVNCAAVCGNDPSRLVFRPGRTKIEDDPTIHYGLIASANQLMKDALVRDKLAEEGILCFEMEAAGLMNDFPCLVIRGICDYSDSHKSKEWQGYAAMVAAAYAKDLLNRIASSKVEAESKIVDILSEVQEEVAGVSRHVKKLLRGHHNKELETILSWITPIDYAPQQVDYFRRRQEGTGQWLLNSTQFQTWLKNREQTLFCSGIPGAGKTIITSIVINDLWTRFQDDSTVGVAYLYCNFRQQSQQRLDDLLACLLKQLVQEKSSLPDNVGALYKFHKVKRSRPSPNEISTALKSVSAAYSRIYIIIDALDECQTKDECRAKFLSEIFDLQVKTGANIFATSRMIGEVAKHFYGCLSLQIRATNEDVETYLNEQMTFMQSDILDDEIRDMIRREIIKAVDGMFLLATLRMRMLLDQPTKGHIKQALGGISKGMDGLNETYEQALERIKVQGQEKRDIAMKALSWTIHAKRPLTTTEIRHALAVIPNTMEIDEDYLPSIELLRSVCAGLLTVDEESDVIRLVHYTTQEYLELEQTQRQWFPDAETQICSTCITYLSYNRFDTGLCLTDEEYETRLRQNPLYDYVAHHWGHHACSASTFCQSVIEFLDKNAQVEASSQALIVVKEHLSDSNYSQRMPREMIGLHLAAYFGVEKLFGHLLHQAPDLDSKDSHGQTPLLWAAQNGHEAVVKLLVDKGAALDSKDSVRGRMPLWWAAQNGQAAVVKLLVDKGAAPDSKDKNGQTPLSRAAQNGCEAVVKLLVEKGAAPDLKDILCRTPLWWAARNGHEAVVKLLADKGAALDSKDSVRGRTPLWWAAKNEQAAMVQLLIDRGAELDLKDIDGRTPLWWAVQNGHESIVRLLLATGRFESHSKNNDGRVLLQRAAENGHESIVRLLLAMGRFGPDSKDSDGQALLHWAAENGHKSIIRLLLAMGRFDPDSKDNDGRALLQWAAENGHESIIRLLLAMGRFDPDSKDNDGRALLHWAAENGHESIVRFMLAMGRFELDSKDIDGRALLHWAAENGHESIVRLLLAKGRFKSVLKDNDDLALLQWAAENGHAAVVELLLATPGVDVNSKDEYDWTPLWSAAASGHAAVVELLLTAPGVDVNSKDKNGTTPLWSAADSGHAAVVELLLASPGVDVNSKDKYGTTPLLSAAGNGHAAVVELLLAASSVDMNSKDECERTPLWSAPDNKHAKVAEALLAAPGVNVNSKEYFSGTSLLSAASNGHGAMVKLLATLGVDVNSKDKFGRTPLWSAADNGHAAVVELLLAAPSVDVNSKDKNCRIPLWSAADSGHAAVVELLLAAPGVDVNSKDKYGTTPLWSAAASGHAAVVELLLAAPGVDVDSKDEYGRTPLLSAAGNGHGAVVKLLLATLGVDVNSKDKYGRTPLWSAVDTWHAAVVELLLAMPGIDMNLKDEYGRTPLLSAAVVDLLLAAQEHKLNS